MELSGTADRSVSHPDWGRQYQNRISGQEEIDSPQFGPDGEVAGEDERERAPLSDHAKAKRVIALFDLWVDGKDASEPDIHAGRTYYAINEADDWYYVVIPPDSDNPERTETARWIEKKNFRLPSEKPKKVILTGYITLPALPGKKIPIRVKKQGGKNTRVVLTSGKEVVVPNETIKITGEEEVETDAPGGMGTSQGAQVAPSLSDPVPGSGLHKLLKPNEQPRSRGKTVQDKRATWNYKGAQIPVEVVRRGRDNTRIRVVVKGEMKEIVVPSNALSQRNV